MRLVLAALRGQTRVSLELGELRETKDGTLNLGRAEGMGWGRKSHCGFRGMVMGCIC